MDNQHLRTGKARRQVRAALHGERPAIQVGRNGVDEALLAAVDQALVAREALKVRIGNSCPDEPQEAALRIASALHADVVSVTGRTVLLYRPAPDDTP